MVYLHYGYISCNVKATNSKLVLHEHKVFKKAYIKKELNQTIRSDRSDLDIEFYIASPQAITQ